MTRPESQLILLAEDDETDVFLLQRAFKTVELSNPVHVVGDGFSAIEFLRSVRERFDATMPGLVILDLKMPRRTGMEVLQWIREQPVLRTLPVIILSSSANWTDVEAAYRAGANGYIMKPASLAERAEVARFLKQWLHLVQPPLAAAEGFRAAQLHGTSL